MPPAESTVEVFPSLEALPADADALFATARDFFATRAWWQIVLSHATLPKHEPRFVLIRVDGAAAGLFPMIFDPADGEFRSLTTAYTCLYTPLIAGDPDVVYAAFARYCRAYPVVRLDALDQETAACLERVGAVRFNHFGNWHENIEGLDWIDYQAKRPGALRQTIRRRVRRAERLAGARYRLFDRQTDLEAGIAAFETIYARSWKEPEPFPAINAMQIRAAAAVGVLRLGIWWIGGTPAAAQFWIVENGQATVLKLAHDEAFKAHSPGTVLTVWMIRHLIETEHVTALDFGRGDDRYKKDWVSSRRQRVGVLLIDRRSPRGLVVLIRHRIGRLLSWLRLRR